MKYEHMRGTPYTGTDEETMDNIRNLLTEEAAVLRAEVAQVRRADAFADLVAADADPASAVPMRPSAPAQAGRRSGPEGKLLSAVMGFQPTTRHLAILCTLLLLVVRPHWFLLGAILAVALAIGLCMTVGAARIWGMVLNRIDRVGMRDPDRAARMRARLDSFACRWDGFLDLFPDGMVDGLYMPDFQGMQATETRGARAMPDSVQPIAHEG